MMYFRIGLYLLYMGLPVGLSLLYSPVLVNTRLLLECVFVVVLSSLLVVNSRRWEKPLYRFLSVFLPACLISFCGFLELIAYYLQGESFNDIFFFHINLDNVITGAKAYSWLAIVPLILTFFTGAIDLYGSRKQVVLRPPPKVFLLGGLAILAIAILPNAPKDFVVGYIHYTRLLKHEDLHAIEMELEKYDVNTEMFFSGDFEVKSAEQPKNLLLIYLESIESSYLDESKFPKLLPHIKGAMEKGVVFTNLHEYPGTGWTIGGMFASQCGTPLLASRNDSLYQNPTLNHLICLGDVLQEAGYYQIYMGGASLDFAGKGRFFQTHGYQEVSGSQELAASVEDRRYRTGWGLYDDTLFDLTFEKFVQVASKDEPFNLTFLTLDTHQPYGAASKSCPPYEYSDNTMLQAVHCTDFLFGTLMKKIQNHPQYENTLILTMSDHLAMHNVASHLYPKERKLIAFALNAGRIGEIDMAGGHVDIVHTILDLLSIETDAPFMLGQSLLKPENPARLAIFQDHQEGLIGGFFRLMNQKENTINICEQNGIWAENLEECKINIGGHELIMTSFGRPTIPEEQIFLVKSTVDGVVEDYKIVSETKAVKIIEAAPDALYFLLTRKAHIPFGLAEQDREGWWTWYLGNPSSVNGIRGIAETFQQIGLESSQCRQMVSQNREGDPGVFALKQKYHRLYEQQQRFQAEQKRYVAAYSRFYPAKIEIISSSSSETESHIIIDNARLIADQGIMLVIIDPVRNVITYRQTHDFTDTPQTIHDMLRVLNELKKNDVVLVATHGEVMFPKSLIQAFIRLGAQKISGFAKGMPYLFIAKVGKGSVAEKIGEPGAIIGKNFLIAEGERDLQRIQQLWNEHVISIQSASIDKGESFVTFDERALLRPRRGINVVVIDGITKEQKVHARFDTSDYIEAGEELRTTLQDLQQGDVLFIVVHNKATGGPAGSRLPTEVVSTLETLGAVHAADIRFGTPYIFVTRIGGDVRIEKLSQFGSILRIDLMPEDVERLFSTSQNS